jgi:hypothetical protein
VSFLLDTVVLSELRKAKPSRKVVRWIKAQKADSLFISVASCPCPQMPHGFGAGSQPGWGMMVPIC